jgi:hypothetical protein
MRANRGSIPLKASAYGGALESLYAINVTLGDAAA